MVKRRRCRILGVMSGTSADSIDVAVCDLSFTPAKRIQADLIAFHEHPIPAHLRQALLNLFRDRRGSLKWVCSLNFALGQAFADAVEACLRRHHISHSSVVAIASHGQTVYHLPPTQAHKRDLTASTLQIAEPAVIAERTGLMVIHNFRAADVAVGGEGAPLVPFADYHLFGHPRNTIVVGNLGGIANVTVLPASNRLEDVIAFDTGPGNMLLDAIVHRFWPERQYDVGGRLASAGRVHVELLERWTRMPFFHLPPPKSTGRELFGEQFLEKELRHSQSISPQDLLATAVEFTARSFVESLSRFVEPRWPIAAIYMGGGGARNRFLMQRIRILAKQLLVRCPEVAPLEKLGMPAKARECVAFAVLGFARLLGLPGNVPSATGASRSVLLGSITEPTVLRGCPWR